MILSLKNIAPILDAKWHGVSENTLIDNISIDSRSLQNGERTLFFALVG